MKAKNRFALLLVTVEDDGRTEVSRTEFRFPTYAQAEQQANVFNRREQTHPVGAIMAVATLRFAQRVPRAKAVTA